MPTRTEVRSVALVGHHGAGKTTLAEALLASTGAIARAGTVERGTTVCDFEPEEISRQLSIGLSVAPIEVDGIRVHVLDTPGYADFAHQMALALSAVELAVVVVSAPTGCRPDPRRLAGGRRARLATRHRDQQARPRARRLRPRARGDPHRLRAGVAQSSCRSARRRTFAA